MVSSNPVISAATSIMTLTPSTTPKTVSPLRILWVRNVSIACLRFFAVCLRHFAFSLSRGLQVSARNASIGSSFAARVAG